MCGSCGERERRERTSGSVCGASCELWRLTQIVAPNKRIVLVVEVAAATQPTQHSTSHVPANQQREWTAASALVSLLAKMPCCAVLPNTTGWLGGCVLLR